MIKAKTNGNRLVQQKLINWSKRILGNDALTQININTIIELFNPIINPYNNPSMAKPSKC
jgi:hypothetical protein